MSETISVVSEVSHLNTTDASVGNVMSREQIRSLPVEAQNVVHLLSLQPGRDLRSDLQPGDRRSALRIGGRRARRPAERHARRHRRQRPAAVDGVHLRDSHDPGSTAGIPRQHVELQRRDGTLERTAGVAHHPQRNQPVRRLRLLDGAPHRDVEQRVLPQAVATGFRQAQRGAETGQGHLRRLVRRPDPAQQAVLLWQSRSAERTERSAGRSQRPVELDARRRADLSMRGRGAVPRRLGERRDGQPHHPGGLLRDDTGRDCRDRSARDRPERSRPHLLPTVPVAERSRPRWPQPDGLPLRRADRERVPQPDQPCRLQACRQPQLLRTLRQAGRHHQQRHHLRRNGSAPAAVVQQHGRRPRLRRGAVADADQQLPLRLHEDRREQRRRDRRELRHVPVHHAVRRQG